MIRLTFSFLFLLTLVDLPTPATGQAPAQTERLSVNQELTDVLERDGVAPIMITLDLTKKSLGHVEHPASDSDVHPTVFDLAMMAAPGALELSQAGSFHVLRLTVTDAALDQVLGRDEVVAVDLDSSSVEVVGLPTVKTSCPATSTRACVQSNYWSISVSYGGATGKVAATSNESAAFWAFRPSNWEVLAKVLNGCGVNGYWWILGSAAGSQSYTINTTVWLDGGSLTIGSWSASNAPIINTKMFRCS